MLSSGLRVGGSSFSEPSLVFPFASTSSSARTLCELDFTRTVAARAAAQTTHIRVSACTQYVAAWRLIRPGGVTIAWVNIDSVPQGVASLVIATLVLVSPALWLPLLPSAVDIDGCCFSADDSADALDAAELEPGELDSAPALTSACCDPELEGGDVENDVLDCFLYGGPWMGSMFSGG